MRKVQGPELLTPGEVSDLLRIDPKTVVRWANTGKVRSIRTIGGHRRIYKEDIDALFAGVRALANGQQP